MNLFETKRLLVRQINHEDTEYLLAIYNKPENMRFISNGKSEWTKKELIEKYERTNADYKIGIGIYAIVQKSKQQIIGEAGLFNSFNNPEKLELGYILDSLFWKQGYGQEICKRLTNYALNTLNAKTLIARMYAKNVNSVALSKKCGMRKIEEGIAENGETFLVFAIEK